MAYCWSNIIERHGKTDYMFRHNKVPAINFCFFSPRSERRFRPKRILKYDAVSTGKACLHKVKVDQEGFHVVHY